MIYTYLCTEHGAFDQNRPLCDWDRPSFPCPACGAESERTAELCAIKADSLWHFGQKTKDGEINSRQALEQYEKKNNLITLVGQRDRDAVRKMAEDGKRGNEAKARAARRKVFEETVAGQGIVNSFGEMNIDGKPS